MKLKRRIKVVSVCALLAAAACSQSSSSTTTGSPTSARKLNVFAAASLTGAFTQIGRDLEAANAGATVIFNFGSSTDLAAQIGSEGTADVFASASGTAMDTVQAKPGVSGRTNFATNRLVIITPPDNPAKISSIQDLANPGVKLVLGAVGVPIGDYAREALKSAGVLAAATANVVSNEPDDKSVGEKVSSGEADAGIVYVSDISAAAGTQLGSVSIPSADNVVATYPIAVVTGTAESTTAQAFITYVTGASGQATLKTFGFGSPPTT
jgi:molybdate transport system substrate-binding protein